MSQIIAILMACIFTGALFGYVPRDVPSIFVPWARNLLGVAVILLPVAVVFNTRWTSAHIRHTVPTMLIPAAFAALAIFLKKTAYAPLIPTWFTLIGIQTTVLLLSVALAGLEWGGPQNKKMQEA